MHHNFTLNHILCSYPCQDINPFLVYNCYDAGKYNVNKALVCVDLSLVVNLQNLRHAGSFFSEIVLE